MEEYPRNVPFFQPLLGHFRQLHISIVHIVNTHPKYFLRHYLYVCSRIAKRYIQQLEGIGQEQGYTHNWVNFSMFPLSFMARRSHLTFIV